MSKIAVKNKKQVLPVVTIIVVVLIFAFIIFSKRQNSGQTGQNNPVQKTAEKITEKTEEVFTGSLKMAVEKGIPMKCTYKQEDQEFEGYVKGKMWHGKMTSKDNQVAEVIIKDNCVWSWNPTDKEKQGVKICFQSDQTNEQKSDIWAEDKVATPDVQYTCLPAVIDDSQFEPPTDINFTDLNQLKTTP